MAHKATIAAVLNESNIKYEYLSATESLAIAEKELAAFTALAAAEVVKQAAMAAAELVTLSAKKLPIRIDDVSLEVLENARIAALETLEKAKNAALEMLEHSVSLAVERSKREENIKLIEISEPVATPRK